MVAVYNLVNTAPDFVPQTVDSVPLITISAVFNSNADKKQGLPTMTWGSNPGKLFVWTDYNSSLLELGYTNNITITSIYKVTEKF